MGGDNQHGYRIASYGTLSVNWKLTRSVAFEAAVQLAHRNGIHVTATCGDKDATYVRGLGSDEVLIS